MHSLESYGGKNYYIYKTCKLVRKTITIYKAEGEYILTVKRLIGGFWCQDPPLSIPQIAVPVDVVEAALTLAYLTSNTREHAVRYFITAAFYFLMKGKEYTSTSMVQQNGKMVHATRTKQFCVMGIGFWKEGEIISRH